MTLPERILRRVERLLDEAEAAADRSDWETMADRAEAVLRFDPGNEDALAFLAAARRDTPPAPAAHSLTPAPGPLPDTFCDGRYQVKRLLGEGGKKRVYLAHDDLLDRDVAFALIKISELDREARERIRREAQAMGRLGTHPNVVVIFDLGETEGQLFIVTELMTAGDVEGLIGKQESRQLPLEQALDLGAQVCSGLAFAHERGIIHRDLKPANVWLTAPAGDGGGGSLTAKVGDFGLALALDRSRLTEMSLMIGTPTYMPPEQALGGSVSERSDLYSLGCMLYEMLCGRPPFLGDDPIAVISQHLNTSPLAPSWFRPQLPAPVESLVLRLLEKDPGKRPSSAREVREALLTLTAGMATPGIRTETGSVGVERSDTAGPSESPLYRRNFLGRERELKILEAAFDSAVSGRGGLVVLTGDTGMGKTAICEQLATYAAIRGGRALHGHCYEEEIASVPYLPFAEVLSSLVAGQGPDQLRQELGPDTGVLTQFFPQLELDMGVVSVPPGGADALRWRLFQAVSRLIHRATSNQPLLIVLDDLHWADQSTVDMLLYVARDLAETRALLICSYRDQDLDAAHPLWNALGTLRRTAGFERLSLAGLQEDVVQRLVSSLVGQEVPRPVAAGIYAQTEGNPLFIQEVVRHLGEEGLLLSGSGAPSRTRQTASILERIPEGLRQVIGRRLARLDGACQQVLSLASVIGRDFRFDVLQRLAGTDDETLAETLERAVRIGVLEEQSKAGRVSYRFALPLVRQMLYEDLLAPRRIRLHQQVARELEAEYQGEESGSVLEEHAAELAGHFSQSPDPGDLQKAVGYHQKAADRACAVYAYPTAVLHLERAVELQQLLGSDARVFVRLNLALGEALLEAGQSRRVVDRVAPDALELAQSLQESGLIARASRLMLNALWRYGAGTMFGTPAYRRWVGLADAHAEEGSADRVHANLALARSAWAMGDDVRAQALGAEALALARRLPDRDLEATALTEALNAPWTAGEHPARQECAKQALTLLETGGGLRVQGLLASAAARAFITAGARDQAEGCVRILERLGARGQDPELQLARLDLRAFMETLAGELDAAVRSCDDLEQLGREVGLDRVSRHLGAAARIRPLLYLGRVDEALAELPYAGLIAGLEELPVLSAVGALCLAHKHDSAGAQDALDSALSLRPIEDDGMRFQVRLLAILLEAAVHLGNREVAAQLLGAAEPLASAVTDFLPACLARHIASAACVLGNAGMAQRYGEIALDVARNVGYRPEAALAQLQLAEILTGQGNSGGQRLLDEAIGELRAMRMEPALQRALRHKGLLNA